MAHLELALRLPMEYIPDPRTVIEDAQDKEKEERDAAERRKVRKNIVGLNFPSRERKKREWSERLKSLSDKKRKRRNSNRNNKQRITERMLSPNFHLPFSLRSQVLRSHKLGFKTSDLLSPLMPIQRSRLSLSDRA